MIRPRLTDSEVAAYAEEQMRAMNRGLLVQEVAMPARRVGADTISTDNDFATLHRRYGGRVGWQGSWCREQAEAADRRWKRENSWWLR